MVLPTSVRPPDASVRDERSSSEKFDAAASFYKNVTAATRHLWEVLEAADGRDRSDLTYPNIQ